MDFKDYKIKDFVDVLSSKKSMPGGGTASALVAVNGISLVLMVCNLTVGKDKYKESEEKIKKSIEKLEKLKDTELNLMDKDAVEFKVMEDVYKMPKDSEEEKKRRLIALEEACKKCCNTPREIIENSLEALKVSTSLYGISNVSAESDLVAANIFLRAAIEGAWQNILINLKYIKDEKFIEEYDAFGKMLMRLVS